MKMTDRARLDADEAELAAALDELFADKAFQPAGTRGSIIPYLSEEARAFFSAPLPERGVGIRALVRDIQTHLAPNATRTRDPRFLALITSGSNPYGLIAEVASAALNQHVARRDISPLGSAIEDLALRWMGAFTGFDENASGVFTSGGSTANLTALAAAITAKAPFDVGRLGLRGGPQLTIYTSDEAHLSVDKAVSVLGIGRENLRRIATTDAFRIDLVCLRAAIESDRQAGALPICVVANAGTVVTGAVDDLNALADLCEEQGLWLHVDAAYGGPAAGTALAGPMFAGLSRAHSVTIDAHKWLYAPYECASVLVHDPAVLLAAFRQDAAYVGVGSNDLHFMNAGLQMSRDLKALKVWALFHGAGAERVRQSIEADIQAIAHMAELIETHPRFELAAPTSLSVVCFRYLPDSEDQDYVDALNRRLAAKIVEDGRVLVGGALVRGRPCLRACCVNYRFDQRVAAEVIETVDELGAAVEREMALANHSVARSIALFSYGTLQLPEVQRSLLGRELVGKPAVLPGYKLESLTIRDGDVIQRSGSATHPIAVRTGVLTDRIEGVVLLLTKEDLARVDAYEVSDYAREEVTLESNATVWAFVSAADPGNSV